MIPRLLAFTFSVVLASSFGLAQEVTRLRILSYNIHHAEGVDGKLDVERIANVVKATSPDLVALQEVDRITRRSQGVDQAMELGRQTGMEVVFGANIDLQGGQYGNAVLSRFPIVDSENHSLPNLRQGEQRGVLVASIQAKASSSTSADPLVFLATHFDHRRDEAERIASAKFVNELVSDDERPMILAGDINDTPSSETLGKLRDVWSSASDQPLATIPVDQPTRQIDFVLFRPADRWRVVEARVVEERLASDHRPLLVELELVNNR